MVEKKGEWILVLHRSGEEKHNFKWAGLGRLRRQWLTVIDNWTQTIASLGFGKSAHQGAQTRRVRGSETWHGGHGVQTIYVWWLYLSTPCNLNTFTCCLVNHYLGIVGSSHWVHVEHMPVKIAPEGQGKGQAEQHSTESGWERRTVPHLSKWGQKRAEGRKSLLMAPVASWSRPTCCRVASFSRLNLYRWN